MTPAQKAAGSTEVTTEHTFGAFLISKGLLGRPQLTEAFAWNPVAQQPPRGALADVDAVVHLAGEIVAGRWTAKKKQTINSMIILLIRLNITSG